MAKAKRSTMNVSLTAPMERYVASLVESGEYASASEVVRHGVRLLKARRERETTLEGLRKSVLESLARADAGEWYDGDEVMREWDEANRSAKAGRRRKSA